MIESLEANIVLPLENDELAQRAGPQAEARRAAGRPAGHRQDDGRPGAGPPAQGQVLPASTARSSPARSDFYGRIHHVFEAAKQNAPGGHLHRRQRRDLRERRGARPVPLPADDARRPGERERRAGVRDDDGDGRRQPAAGAGPLGAGRAVAGDAAARMRTGSAADPGAAGAAAARRDRRPTSRNWRRRRKAFTGADLKRLVQDGKALFGFDRCVGLPLKSPTEYFLAAIECVQSSKAKYAEAEACE